MAGVGPVMAAAWMTLPTITRWRLMTMSSNYYDDDMYYGDEYVGPDKYGTEVKRCRMCECKVEMSTDHGVCDSCASAMERGAEW
jgi:hypothetical protein